MFHIELRQFPHNVCRFNMTEAELATLVEPWSREQWIELGERKWSPHQARLTVLEGPQLPIEQLSMGRGWRNAQRQSEDVTERVLARAATSDTRAETTNDTELLPLLGPDPAALLQAWRLAGQRRPELSPSESLALAESTLRSLDGS
jgi:hypothetical protein